MAMGKIRGVQNQGSVMFDTHIYVQVNWYNLLGAFSSYQVNQIVLVNQSFSLCLLGFLIFENLRANHQLEPRTTSCICVLSETLLTGLDVSVQVCFVPSQLNRGQQFLFSIFFFYGPIQKLTRKLEKVKHTYYKSESDEATWGLELGIWDSLFPFVAFFK